MDSFALATRLDDGTANFPARWAQGRSVFGGLLVATALRALPQARPVRSIQATFLAPVAPGPASIVAHPLRSGRALTHYSVDVVQAGAVVSQLQVALAEDRPGLLVPAAPRPNAPSPDGLVELAFMPGITPAFTQNYAYRWASGRPPFTGARVEDGGAAFSGWCRPREDADVDVFAVVALLDAWPAPLLPLFPQPAPASTVHWAINLAIPWERTWPGDAWWFYDARTRSAAGGHGTFDADLWAPDGAHVASSRQLVAEFSGS